MSVAALAMRTTIFTIVFPGSVTVMGPSLVLQAGPDARLSLGAARFLGIVPIAIGVSILLWCFADFVRAGRGTPAPWDAPKYLVTRGLYRLVRNPMYVGILTVLIGEALVFRSAWLFAYAGVVWLVFHLFITAYEEPTLRRTFGESYEAYRASVPRWIPRPVRT